MNYFYEVDFSNTIIVCCVTHADALVNIPTFIVGTCTFRALLSFQQHQMSEGQQS